MGGFIMSCLSEIKLSRTQRVFVTPEPICGTLTYAIATSDFVLPAGNAVMNQTPTFVDSEELANTLDVLDQFVNAMPPGEFTLPMYMRTTGAGPTVYGYGTPQGSILLESLQGAMFYNTRGTIHTTFHKNATMSLIHYETSSTAPLPPMGVIRVGTQDIYYGELLKGVSGGVRTLGRSVVGTTSTGMFASLATTYRGTAWTASSAGDTFNVVSKYYKQDQNSPSFTLWIENDGFVQGLVGCTVSEATLGVNNEGALTLNSTGQGMEMVWAGGSTLVNSAFTIGATRIEVTNTKQFSVGAPIYNVTKNDSSGASAGYRITELGSAATPGQVLVLAAGLTAETWDIGDVIAGWLPPSNTIGTPIESRLSNIQMDGIDVKFKSGDFTFGAPKEYLVDEVGTDFPEDYLENMRSITSTLNVYFRAHHVAHFTDGYAGDNDVIIRLTFGETEGQMFEVYMKRCRLEVPTITFAAPAVELNIPMKALGSHCVGSPCSPWEQEGENSCDMWIR